MSNDMRLMHEKRKTIDVSALADMYTKSQVIDAQVDGSILHALQPVYEQINAVRNQIIEIN